MEGRRRRPVGRASRTPGGYLRLTVYLLPEEWDALHDRSYLDGRSISELIRRAVRVYLNLDRSPAPRRARE